MPTDAPKSTGVSLGYECAFGTFDKDSQGRLVGALKNIVFRHASQRSSVLRFTPNEIEHKAEPGESKRFVYKRLQKLFEQKVLQKTDWENPHGGKSSRKGR